MNEKAEPITIDERLKDSLGKDLLDFVSIPSEIQASAIIDKIVRLCETKQIKASGFLELTIATTIKIIADAKTELECVDAIDCPYQNAIHKSQIARLHDLSVYLVAVRKLFFGGNDAF